MKMVGSIYQPPLQILGRRFKLKGLSGVIWRGLKAVSPPTAHYYLDDLMRADLRRLPSKRTTHASSPTPIALLGAFLLDIGIARAAQILRAGLEAAELPLHPMDCSALLRRTPGPRPPLPAAPAGGTLVICVNPPNLARVLRRFGPEICARKRLIGYWWWELDRLPRAWMPWAELMDEIWVSSRFIQETFARALPGKPIRYIPLPVPEPVPSAAGRAQFGLAEGRFTVLVAFDLASRWARKNPVGAIAAFRRAFPAGADAQLVLKVNGGEKYEAELRQLRALTADLPHAVIIDRALSAGDLAALIRAADVYLSLHRSEGLGLFIAEAMWLGTPVVATGWSGVMDLVDDETALLVRYKMVPVGPSDYPSVPPGAQWAEPDIDHAAQCLQRLADDPDLRAELRAKARARAEQQFSLDRFRALVPSLLQPLAGDNEVETQ